VNSSIRPRHPCGCVDPKHAHTPTTPICPMNLWRIVSEDVFMSNSVRPRFPCECADPGCPAHLGLGKCAEPTYARSRLYRIDMEDHTGTVFCEECYEDALDSGVFSPRKGD
jgi:hypothetical protein